MPPTTPPQNVPPVPPQQPRAVTQQPIAQKPSRTLRVSAIVIVMLIALAFGGFYGYLKWSVAQEVAAFPKELEDALSLANEGRFSEAAAKAQLLVAKAPDAEQQAVAIRLQGYSYLSSGTSSSQIQAVLLMKEQYRRDRTNPEAAAQDINVLLEYVTASRNVDVFNAVFSEEFAEYKVENDLAASLTQLAQYSYSLHPTTGALYQMAAGEVGPLYRGKTLGLTREQRKMRADTAIKYLTEAEQLYTEERKSANPADIMGPMKHYYWMGYLWGGVATFYPERLKESETGFQAGIAYYEKKYNEAGALYPVLEARMPTLYLAYAHVLLIVGKEARSADIHKNLDNLMAMVNARPIIHGQFIGLMQRAGDGTNFSPAAFRLLGEFYKPFEEFLGTYGYVVVRSASSS